MPRRPPLFPRLPVAVLVIVALALIWWRGRHGAQRTAALEVGKTVMGTQATVTLWPDGDETAANADARAVLALFDAVETRFSPYREDSELSRLNATAHVEPFACSAPMWTAVELGREAWEVSDGAFDVTAGPLMHLWGFHRRRDSVPTAAEIAAARELVGFDKLILDPGARTVAFPRPGMVLDFGGILKGYAVDLAAAELARRGRRVGIVDLGGNIRCLPQPPPGRESYRIGVRHPRHPRDPERLLGTVRLLDQAIATSGDYERFVTIDGQRYSHIMDPRTGYPVRGLAAVTVVAPSGLATDVLSTSIFVNGGTRIASLRERYPQTQLLLVRVDTEGNLILDTYGEIWHEVGAPE